jgi:3-oxoacyl-[acyl-carrier-protein] synthase III
MPAVITGLAYQVGTPTPLAELIGRWLPAETAEQLLARGQRMCPLAPSELPLIRSSVTASLETAGLAPALVDRVLVTSESILVSGSKREHEMTRARLYTTMAELGLGHAPVLMLTFAGCGSAIAALEYASLLVDRGDAANVLVVAADRVLDGGQRVLPPVVSIVGDGVASCVVTGQTDDRDGLVLRWVRRRAFLEVAKHDRGTDFGPALVMLGRSLASIAREIRATTPVLDHARLICNNYGLPTVRLFGRTLGVADDRVFTENVSRIGHLGSPDPLVNLSTLPDRSGGVVVLATGPADCAVALVTTLEDGALP